MNIEQSSTGNGGILSKKRPTKSEIIQTIRKEDKFWDYIEEKESDTQHKEAE